MISCVGSDSSCPKYDPPAKRPAAVAGTVSSVLHRRRCFRSAKYWSHFIGSWRGSSTTGLAEVAGGGEEGVVEVEAKRWLRSGNRAVRGAEVDAATFRGRIATRDMVGAM